MLVYCTVFLLIFSELVLAKKIISQPIKISVTSNLITLPIGTLTHDGPATPEQISLFLPITGNLPQTAVATVRYKVSGQSLWHTGHPLYRIRPSMSDTPDVGIVPDAFAWPIIDLKPATTYDVEVTVTSGNVSNVLNATFTTRSLPAEAGSPNKTINPGTTASGIQSVLDSLNPGDVLLIKNGTYNLSTYLLLNRSGTVNNPIYIRGESRTGVILSNPNQVLEIAAASDVVVENLTLKGSGIDSGVNASSGAIGFVSSGPMKTRITVRNLTMTGFDTGIAADKEISQFLAYDNTLVGNNTWIPSLINTNATWNDDAIRIPGFGNCVFNNSLRGFGDTFSFAQHSTQVIGVHFYRNDVSMGGDDGFEVDEGQRNLSIYDNKLRNIMTFVSLDPLFGGPLVVARNIAINIGRTPFKWNSTNSGQFIYNNTIIRTTGKYWVDSPGSSAEAGWYQPNNGGQNSYGYRNNIMIYQGAGNQMIRLDNSGHNPVDFTHNSWFPDLIFQWPEGRSANLAQAMSGLPDSTPVFSGTKRRMQNDNITISSPWISPIALAANYLTEVTTSLTPLLAPGTTPKNSGTIIPNITDGFTGGAPDRGALIEGRGLPQYGDRR